MKLPDSNPLAFLKQPDPFTHKQRIVLVGDSLTQGRLSVDYVKMLANRLGEADYEFINAGINSELAWNVLQRLEPIVECRPHVVTLLVGINDVNSVLSPLRTTIYTKFMKLPQVPDQDFYRSSLRAIVDKLSKETDARIALISTAPMGERLESRELKLSTEYGLIMKEVAFERGVAYLPLHEQMVACLKENPGNPISLKQEPVYILKKTILYKLFKKDRDEIGRKAGFSLHTDFLHLNTRGAQMVADLIEEFIIDRNFVSGRNRIEGRGIVRK